ncbi:beta-ketoacyl synthase chain length factor [Arcobacter sp.]|uniref:beta-ketoacyl synthase chain length factor n=1 Tax=Arcobacter sp. TaxID=1872629 RepID=UPI003D0AED5A
MKINLEILEASYLFDEKEIQNLNTKKLVPNMMVRRRLTRASKLAIELISKINYQNNRIIYGTSYGELLSTSNILNAILNNETISPTDFQNSVYNTAISYTSIISKNTNEMLTVSSGEDTSLKVLKAGAIKALDNDELILICLETINIENIEDINNCIKYLESGVALKIKLTQDNPTINFINFQDKNYPKSIEYLLFIAKNFDRNKKNIIEVNI